MNDENQTSNLVADLVTKWEESIEIGIHLSPKEICQSNPELEDVVTKQITKLKRMRWLTSTWDWNSLETLSPDTLVGHRFRIESVLGSGSFGTVYKAMDSELLRHVAIKIENSTRNGHPNGLLAEARKVAILRHPHIVPVFDVGRHEGRIFIISQLIEGQNLRDVSSSKQLSTDQIIRWMTQVAHALKNAHEKGLIHRDLKPSNIIIETNQQAMVSDFGIAFHADEVQDIEPSVGTLAYMSPEQVQGHSSRMGTKSDIFSFGIVLYELLAGKHPFHNKLISETINNIIASNPEPLSDTSQVLQKLCAQCLSKKTEDRQTAAEVADRLSDFLDTGKSHSTTISTFSPLIAYAFIMVIIGVGWAWWQYFPTIAGRNTNNLVKLRREIDRAAEPTLFGSNVADVNTHSPNRNEVAAGNQIPTIPQSNQISVLPSTKTLPSILKPSNAVNLIPLIEPSSHTVRGLWTKSNDILTTVSPEGGNESVGGAIQINYHPHSAYTLTIRARRIQNGGIIVPVVYSGRQFGVYLAAGWVGSKIPEARPVFKADANFFPTTDWHVVTVDVDSNGVRCAGDCGAVLRWKADYAAVEGRPYDIPDATGLYLKVWGRYEIDTLMIEERGE